MGEIVELTLRGWSLTLSLKCGLQPAVRPGQAVGTRAEGAAHFRGRKCIAIFMGTHRIHAHPILPVPVRPDIRFYWNGSPLAAKPGEMISSALIANGIQTFGRHHRDGAGQGLFCANGQCSKCLVLADGVPVKSCMTAVRENMTVKSVHGLPELPPVQMVPDLADIEEVATDVLIIGGGPAGASAAIELGGKRIRTLVVDDKSELGGKLVLQTHKFFGSVEDSHAGTRGNRIGEMLAEAVREQSRHHGLAATARRFSYLRTGGSAF